MRLLLCHCDFDFKAREVSGGVDVAAAAAPHYAIIYDESMRQMTQQTDASFDA